MIKALVCGGRGVTDAARLERVLDAAVQRLGVTEIIQGGAPGVDSLTKAWAAARGVPQRQFDADWGALGRAAGPIRNLEMLTAGKPDLVLAFVEGAGPGTMNMIKQATHQGIRVIEC